MTTPIEKTTKPWDDEISFQNIHPNSLYKKWIECLTSTNPIQFQIDFYNNNKAEIVKDLNLYNYWYNKIYSLHPAVQKGVREIKEFKLIGSSVGSLYYFRSTESVIPIRLLDEINIPVVNAVNYGKLHPEIYAFIAGANNTVNRQQKQLYKNFQMDPNSSSTSSHGDRLVKDELHPIRIDEAKPLIVEELEHKYEVLLDMTTVQKFLFGNVAILDNVYPYYQDGVKIELDSSLRKIERKQGWITLWKLKPK